MEPHWFLALIDAIHFWVTIVWLLSVLLCR